MEATIIGRRYAKALVKLAGNAGLDKTGEEIRDLAGQYAASPEFQSMIIDPGHSRTQKSQVVGQIVDKLGYSDLIKKFARYLTSQGRFSIIEAVATSFERLSMEIQNKAKGSITVAEEISDEQLRDLEKKLSETTKKAVSLEVKVDPAIIGGAITQIGSLVLDGSIKNRLNLIRETISKGN